MSSNNSKNISLGILEEVLWISTITILVVAILFMTGFLKYEPIAILSNSMLPTFSNGDMVVYEKVDEESLKSILVNTIIVYSIGDTNVVHRVVETLNIDGKIYYRTKGDMNNMPDANLVGINQIKGIYKFHIKYMGFPSIWLYKYFHS